MFSLDFIPKDLEIKTNNIPSKKTQNKNSNKDFSEVLGKQKESLRNSESIDKKQEKPVKNPTKLEKNTKHKVEEKELDIVEDLEELDEISEELLALLQSLYNLLQELEINPKKLNKTNLETIELKIEQISNLLEETIIEMDEDIPFFEEQFITETLETIEKLEETIETVGKEFIKYEKHELIDEDELSKLPIKEKLEKLNKTLDSLKFKTENSSEFPAEISMEQSRELEVDIDTKDDISAELEETIEKYNMPIEEEEVEDFSKQKDLDAEVGDIENIIPSFEIRNKNIIKEMPNLEFEKAQDINTKDVVHQIVDKAKLVLDDYKQEIKISLKPEILGELILKMESEKGNLLARIMVDNYRTKELIEANLYQLKQDMKENGLEIKTFEVFVGTNEDFQRERKQEFQEFNLGKRHKKIKVKDVAIKGIQMYDEKTLENVQDIYEEGSLNLFA